MFEIFRFFSKMTAFVSFTFRFFTIVQYSHFTWLSSLPFRSGPLEVVVANARVELQQRKARTSWFFCFSTLVILTVGIAVSVVVEGAEKRFPRPKPFKIFIFMLAISYLLCELILFFYLALSLYASQHMESLPTIGRRLVFCSTCSMAALAYTVWLSWIRIEDFQKTGSRPSDPDSCIVYFVTRDLSFPIMMSVVFDMAAFVNYSPRQFWGSLATGLRKLADWFDAFGGFMEDNLCFCCINPRYRYLQPTAAMHDSGTTLSVRNGAAAPSLMASTLLDVEYGEADEHLNLRRSSIFATPGTSADILQAMSMALNGTDVDPLIIPSELIEISSRPIAAGGFAQVHRGVFAGKRVAVKKIFAQMAQGNLDDFIHEIRILSNLRGAPHVLLLHGVSLEEVHGEQIVVMVLEWCPLSLNSLVHDTKYSEKDSKSQTSSSNSASASERHVLPPTRLRRQESAGARSVKWLASLGKNESTARTIEQPSQLSPYVFLVGRPLQFLFQFRIRENSVVFRFY